MSEERKIQAELPVSGMVLYEITAPNNWDDLSEKAKRDFFIKKARPHWCEDLENCVNIDEWSVKTIAFEEEK
jgi:hypothetical protein